MAGTADSDWIAPSDSGDTTTEKRPRLSRRGWALLATATLVVAPLSGAAGWELNSRLSNSGTSAAIDRQWLLKLVDLAAQFPSGFHLTSADAADLAEQSRMMQGATVIPANCANPAERNGGVSPPAGAILDSLAGRTQGRVLEVTALASPQPIPVRDVPPHCDAVVFYKAGLIQGFTGPVSPPPIPDGVAVKSSQAVRVRYTVTDGTGPRIDTVCYVYRALLDDLHSVTVTFAGQISPGPLRDIDPTPASDLFTHALTMLQTS
ncbi:DUF5642 family protein [Mycolicibacterium fortuitum]|uniref:DUF5642 family protein n=1 Tax=Mycolicibacterium fortuitum TaxID=1766 RepID=UPI000A4B39BC|nr:DUF5642 family protein [Mycolicibacterium fortuitum]UBV12716.1 DUF5642 family protein [Mycolicibacterium fortuitum]